MSHMCGACPSTSKSSTQFHAIRRRLAAVESEVPGTSWRSVGHKWPRTPTAAKRAGSWDGPISGQHTSLQTSNTTTGVRRVGADRNDDRFDYISMPWDDVFTSCCSPVSAPTVCRNSTPFSAVPGARLLFLSKRKMRHRRLPSLSETLGETLGEEESPLRAVYKHPETPITGKA